MTSSKIGRHGYAVARRLTLHLAGVFPLIIAAMATELEEAPLHYKIVEELPRGAQIGSLIDDARLRDKYSSEVLRVLRFRFLAESVELFDVGSATGVIRTTEVIDRDSPSLCRQRELCEISLDVVVQPSQYFQIIKVKVEIADLNDNSPKFREGHIYLSIIEAAQVGSVYILPTAVDFDSPANGVQRYELESQSTKFILQSTTKIDGLLEVRLVLKEKLDREYEAQYRLRLAAYDGGTSPRNGTSTIVVNVLDSNDNRPVFVNNQYEVNIIENLPIETTILTVHAVDRDSGPNGQVEYGLTQQTETLLGSKFGICNTTGAIFIRGGIDHEQASVFQLVVFARDHGSESFSSEATVVVHVEDMNDNAPEVTISTLTPSSGSFSAVIAEVWENATLGTFVAHVSVVDHDAGTNGRVNCTLNDNTFTLVRKFATEYQIVTNAPLDRERTEQYALTLKCQDGALVSRVTEKTLRVIVGDVNDNSPVFSQQVFKGSLLENNSIGASIMHVTASDWDDGDNARLQFSIPGNVASLFHVDHRGVISAHSSIDHEKYDVFRFPILAADMGTPTRTGSALVVITIEDINDEKPRFTQPSYIFSVLENEPAGTIVGKVTAEDKDGPMFNAFAYAFLTETSVGPGTFAINPSSGSISTQKPLDRELKGLYKFVIVAYDLKVISMSGSASVSVNVLDRNDNSPEFLFPRKSNDTVYISNLLPVDHVVTEVVARDLDLDDNSRITFKITDERTDPGVFRIDPVKGTIQVNSRLSGINYRTFRLTISATDQGIPPRSQTAELKIHVNRTVAFGPVAAQSNRTVVSAFSAVLVTVLVSGVLVVLVVMCVAVALVRQRDRRRRARKQTSRMEALRILTTSGGGGGGVPVAATTKDPHHSSPESSPRKRPMCNGESRADTTPGQDVSLAGTLLQSLCVDSPSSEGNRSTRTRVWNTQTQHEDLQSSAPSDFDKISDPSIVSSVTDSGRGVSEEGDGNPTPAPYGVYAKVTRDRFLPPPPPPPRGSYWLQHHRGYTQQCYQPGVRFSELSTTPEEEADPGSRSTPMLGTVQSGSKFRDRAARGSSKGRSAGDHEDISPSNVGRRESPDEGLPPEFVPGIFDDDSPDTVVMELPGYEDENGMEERLVGITEASDVKTDQTSNGSAFCGSRTRTLKPEPPGKHVSPKEVMV